jgi:hypothetical protein
MDAQNQLTNLMAVARIRSIIPSANFVTGLLSVAVMSPVHLACLACDT